MDIIEKEYWRLFESGIQYPDPKFNKGNKKMLLSKVKVKYVDNTINKKTLFYESFTDYGPEGRKQVKPENQKFYDKMYNMSLQKIDKYGKKHGVSSEQYKHEYSSRGGWAIYASKTNNPNDIAILLDYSPDFFYVKK